MPKLIMHAPKTGNYTILANENITNSALSLRARGLLALLLSLPCDWKIRKTWLYKQSQVEGRDAINRAWQELKTFGFITQQKVFDPKTKRIVDHHFIVNEIPMARELDTSGICKTLENHLSEQQTPENQQLLNTNLPIPKKIKPILKEPIAGDDNQYRYWQTQFEKALNHNFNDFEKIELQNWLNNPAYTENNLLQAVHLSGLAHAKSVKYVTQVLENLVKQSSQSSATFIDIPFENIFM